MVFTLHGPDIKTLWQKQNDNENYIKTVLYYHDDTDGFWCKFDYHSSIWNR
jgi:hypothetical protein